MTPRSMLALVGCGALFGLSYVLVRQLVPLLGPVAVTVGRTLIGGVLLLSAARLRREPIGARRWPAYLALGALSAAIPFTLISLSMLTLDAGTAAVLNASAPLIALGIDAVARRAWPRPAQLGGVLAAIAGVVVVMSARGVGVGHGAAVGVLAGLTGAAVFAYAGFFAARRFDGTPPLAVAAGQQLAAAVLLVPLLPVFPPSHVALGRLVVLGILGSGLAYLLFYWLIASVGPALTANVNLLVPMFGVLWGWALLGEPVMPWSLAGTALTVAGLVFVLRPAPPRQADRS